MYKTYSSSPNKVLLVSAIIFFVMCLVFAFSKGRFEPSDLGIGATFGLLLALFPLIHGFGQKVELTDKEIIYSSSLLTMFISKFKKKLLLTTISEVRLGTPKFNNHQATFAAINISSEINEITFNPDLFNNDTLHNLFQELKTRNSNIKFDSYSLKLIEKGKDGEVFPKMVLNNYLWTSLLIILNGLISLVFYKMEIISKEALFVFTSAQIIIVPIIFNWLVNTFNKRNS